MDRSPPAVSGGFASHPGESSLWCRLLQQGDEGLNLLKQIICLSSELFDLEDVRTNDQLGKWALRKATKEGLLAPGGPYGST